MTIKNTEDWALLLLTQIHLAPDADDLMRGSVAILKGLSHEDASRAITILNSALKNNNALTAHTSLMSSAPYGFAINKDGGFISYKGPRFEKRNLINTIHAMKNADDKKAMQIESESALSNPNISSNDQKSLIFSVDLSAFTTKPNLSNDNSIASAA